MARCYERREYRLLNLCILRSVRESLTMKRGGKGDTAQLGCRMVYKVKCTTKMFGRVSSERPIVGVGASKPQVAFQSTEFPTKLCFQLYNSQAASEIFSVGSNPDAPTHNVTSSSRSSLQMGDATTRVTICRNNRKTV
jgi:hypothetical protein